MDSKQIIIDGYNLIKSVSEFTCKTVQLSAQREHLIRLLISSPFLHNKKIVIVFDGGDVKSSLHLQKYHNIKLVYSGNQTKADDIIQEMIRSSNNVNNLIIVSNDKEIQFTAKSHGATHIDSHIFWNKIRNVAKQKSSHSQKFEYNNRELTDKEVQKWLKIFTDRKSNNEES